MGLNKTLQQGITRKIDNTRFTYPTVLSIIIDIHIQFVKDHAQKIPSYPSVLVPHVNKDNNGGIVRTVTWPFIDSLRLKSTLENKIY